MVQQTVPQNTVWQGIWLFVLKDLLHIFDDESINESDKKIPRFASLKNDDDYDSDSKDNMPMQEDDDEYIQKLNSDNETDSNVGIIADHNSVDESTNKTLNDDSSTIYNDQEEGEHYDFDEWFEEQMDIHDNKSEKSSGKEDNFVLGQHHQQ